MYEVGRKDDASCLESVGLEVSDADGDDLEVGRAKLGRDVRGSRELVVHRALREELRIEGRPPPTRARKSVVCSVQTPIVCWHTPKYAVKLRVGCFRGE